jgi:hypothetical protein
MNHDQDTVLVELTINDQGDVQLKLVDPPSGQPDELVFTPPEEGMPSIRRPLSEEVKKWLRRAKPATLDDPQRISAASALPPDPSTISICNTPLS